MLENVVFSLFLGNKTSTPLISVANLVWWACWKVSR